MRIGIGLILALLCSVTPARAKTSLDVEVGWEGVVRQGRWTPVQVTVSDPSLPSATIEVAAAHDVVFSMRVMEHVGALTQLPKTFVIYVPVNGYLGMGAASALSVVVREAGTGKVLAHTREDDPSAFNAVQQMDAQGQLIGVSGRRTGLHMLRSSRAATSRLAVGYLPLEALPLSPAGYDALDLMVLNAADLAQISDDQQRALLDWVRAGGNLLYWPGTDPVPERGPLVDALPCRIRGATVVPFTPDQLKAFSLPSRFAKIPARTLDPSGRRGEPVGLINDHVTAYRTDLGLGRIVVSPIDLSDLQSIDQSRLYGLWRPALQGMLDLTILEGTVSNTYYNNFGPYEQRQAASERILTDLLGDVPGAGQFGFSYVAIVLAGLMVIVGPIDWFVLRALRRQAWTWVTTSGWIGLVTLGALYAGHAFKSGELHYRTYGLVDQAADGVVARTEYVGLYSPQTTRYTLDTDPTGWWEPLAPSQYYYVQRTGSELGFAQSYHGNTPLPMQVNVWSLRFQKGDRYAAAPKLLDADLTLHPGDPGRVTGRVRNLTDRPLRNVQVILAGRASPVMDSVTVPGHGAAEIDFNLSEKRDRDAKNFVPQYGYIDQYESVAADTRTAVRAAEGLAANRARQIDRRLEDGAHAVVVAEQDGASPSVTLKEGDAAVQRHVTVIRALLPVRQPKTPAP